MQTRDRAAATTAVIMLAVALGTLVQWPPRDLQVTLFHQTLQARLSAQWVLALLAGTLAAIGTHYFVTGHPVAARHELPHTAHYWPLPALLAAGATLALARPLALPFRLTGLVVAGCLIMATLLAEYVSIAGAPRSFEHARWLLSLIAYGAALVVFEVAFTSTIPGRLIAIGCTFAAGLLTVELLRQQGRTPDRVTLYSLTFAVLIGLTAWRLLLLPMVSPLQASLVLLLELYVLTGSAQQRLRDRLSWATASEFCLLFLIGGWAILRMVP